MTNPIDRATFTAWLEAHAVEDVVGSINATCDCPLARFLRHCGAAEAWVRPNVFSVYVGPLQQCERHRTTPWQRQFVDGVDKDGVHGAPVTAANALAVLRAIPEDD